MKLAFLVLACLAGVAFADNYSNYLHGLVERGKGLMDQAKDLLETTKNPNDSSALEHEIDAIQKLLNNIEANPSDIKGQMEAAKQLARHERIISMLIIKAKHMHPMPVEPPHGGENDQGENHY